MTHYAHKLRQEIEDLKTLIAKNKLDYEKSKHDTALSFAQVMIESMVKLENENKDLKATIEMFELNNVPKKPLVQVSSPKAQKSADELRRIK